MIEENIRNFILNAVAFDVTNFIRERNAPAIEEYEENQWSYLIEIMLISIKSLLPCQEKLGNRIDYRRFKAELELWKSYRHGMNRNLLYTAVSRARQCVIIIGREQTVQLMIDNVSEQRRYSGLSNRIREIMEE